MLHLRALQRLRCGWEQPADWPEDLADSCQLDLNGSGPECDLGA